MSVLKMARATKLPCGTPHCSGLLVEWMLCTLTEKVLLQRKTAPVDFQSLNPVLMYSTTRRSWCDVESSARKPWCWGMRISLVLRCDLLPSISTISESQPTIPTFNTNYPLYLEDQAVCKKSRTQLLPKYNETSTPRLQISKSNIPTQVAAIAVKNFAAPKRPLKPR
ncbi:hypothetical protein TNCV_5117741 [Trichonephila clavipes]|nr:hypothetical protein TNCV_5117741 [Trichonephila clavipes]